MYLRKEKGFRRNLKRTKKEHKMPISNNNMHRFNKVGLDAEDWLIRTLRMEKGTDSEDMHKDIDCYSKEYGSVSIKSVRNTYRNFALEIRKENSRDRSDKKDSWFVKGVAETYMVIIRNDETKTYERVYIINAKKLKDYVKLNRRRFKEVVSEKVSKSSYNKARRYDVPVVYLISFDEMKRAGLIEKTLAPKKK